MSYITTHTLYAIMSPDRKYIVTQAHRKGSMRYLDPVDTITESRFPKYYKSEGTAMGSIKTGYLITCNSPYEVESLVPVKVNVTIETI